jgi:hypothetical protein
VDRQPYATFVVELLLDEQGNVRRTRVVHVQTGIERTWAGWDEERLIAILRPTGPRSPGQRSWHPLTSRR